MTSYKEIGNSIQEVIGVVEFVETLNQGRTFPCGSYDLELIEVGATTKDATHAL